MRRFPYLSLGLLLLLLLGASCAAVGPADNHVGSAGEASAARVSVPGPNIVLFLFDDAGYSDLSAFGGEIETPTIAALAQEGVTIARFYTAARCSPTRAGVLTGMHPHAVGMADLAHGRKLRTDFPSYRAQLPLDVPLLSELLQAQGYRTLLQGKWHLGEVPGASDDEALPPPNRRGFDEFVGIVGAQAAPYRLDPASHPYTHNGKPLAIEPDWYAVEGLNRVTMSLLDSLFQESPETPFFLYVASQAPHKPVDAPDELVAKYRAVYAQPLETLWQARVDGLVATGLLPAHAPLAPPRFTEAQRERLRSTAAQRAAMLEAADTALGELVDLLKRRGKLDDTLIIVASDNGAAAEAALLANAPFRGAKGNLWEGATLSPLVATWKNGGLTQRSMLREPVSYLDIMPTVLEAAGIEYPVVMPGNEAAPQLPGVSFLPALRGEPQQPMPDFYWNLYGRFAVLHEGRWKLHAAGYSEARERRGLYPPLKLFDLQADPAETRDVSAENPELVQALLQRYEAWAQAHHAVEYYRVLDAYAANRRAIERERQQKLQEAVRKLMLDRPGEGK